MKTNKKAELGATFNMILTIFVVFFIIMFFLIASISISLKKDIIYISSEESAEMNIIAANTLASIQEINAGQDKRVNELFVDWYKFKEENKAEEIKNEIKEKITNILNGSLGEYDFILEVKCGKKEVEEHIKQLEAERNERLRSATMTAGGPLTSAFLEERTLEFSSDYSKCFGIPNLRSSVKPAIMQIPVKDDSVELKLYVVKC